MLARIVFGLLNFAARNGIRGGSAAPGLLAGVSVPPGPSPAKLQARSTGIRGETYAYWYLRRHGYIFVARNYKVAGIPGEIDLVGYDGAVLAFVEVKTRTGEALPEEAVDWAKRRHIMRMARQFISASRIPQAQFRFDVLAIDSHPGKPPLVRLHKNAFSAAS